MNSDHNFVPYFRCKMFHFCVIDDGGSAESVIIFLIGYGLEIGKIRAVNVFEKIEWK